MKLFCKAIVGLWLIGSGLILFLAVLVGTGIATKEATIAMGEFVRWIVVPYGLLVSGALWVIWVRPEGVYCEKVEEA